jgi:hypothetical protein
LYGTQVTDVSALGNVHILQEWPMSELQTTCLLFKFHCILKSSLKSNLSSSMTYQQLTLITDRHFLCD